MADFRGQPLDLQGLEFPWAAALWVRNASWEQWVGARC